MARECAMCTFISVLDLCILPFTNPSLHGILNYISLPSLIFEPDCLPVSLGPRTSEEKKQITPCGLLLRLCKLGVALHERLRQVWGCTAAAVAEVLGLDLKQILNAYGVVGATWRASRTFPF